VSLHTPKIWPACLCQCHSRPDSRCAEPAAVVVEPDATAPERLVGFPGDDMCRHLRGAGQSFAYAGSEGEGVTARSLEDVPLGRCGCAVGCWHVMDPCWSAAGRSDSASSRSSGAQKEGGGSVRSCQPASGTGRPNGRNGRCLSDVVVFPRIGLSGWGTNTLNLEATGNSRADTHSMADERVIDPAICPQSRNNESYTRRYADPLPPNPAIGSSI
jgi:hypothetical protein